jgi:hypothetical protein
VIEYFSLMNIKQNNNQSTGSHAVCVYPQSLIDTISASPSSGKLDILGPPRGNNIIGFGCTRQQTLMPNVEFLNKCDDQELHEKSDGNNLKLHQKTLGRLAQSQANFRS